MALEDPQLTSAETVASSPRHFPSSSSHEEDEGRFIPGTLLNGRYRVSGLLGRGGMGEVYRATDLTLGQSVALKFLPESASGNVRLLERFHGEVRLARQVSHPNICRVHDIGEVDGVPFISMEYVDGEDLSSLLQRIGRLPYDKALETARKICAGLAAAHDKGIIHRDLKPQNIMLNKRGEVVIMDFGLASVADSLTGAEARNGTPAYMSPEQLKGLEATAKSDLYSLGVVLFELFTGHRPFDAKNVQAMIDQQEAMQISGKTALTSELDPAVEKAIRRCLDPSPAKRPSTALAVSAALPGGDPLAAALAAGETPSPEMVAAAGSTEGLSPKWALSCLLVILLCLFAAPFLRQSRTGLMQAPLRNPPEVLTAKSREFAVQLGYPKEPADSTGSFSNRSQLLEYLKRRNTPGEWPNWAAAEPPISYFYREALFDLIAWPLGYVTATNPAPIAPGMAQIELDGNGRLRGFSGVPYAEPPAAGTAIAEPDAIFRFAGLDASKFTEVEPKTLPRSATDRLRAWKGSHPAIANLPLTIEIGWWKSQVTWVKIIWPWMDERGVASDGGSPFRMVRFSVLVILIAGVGIFAILLASRNWKLGRVDKRGAWRLAMMQLLFGLVIWIGSTHVVPNGAMFDLFLNGFANCLYPAAILWVVYLALEPSVRARWPQSIVTWNRVLAGKFSDSQVAAHVLMGMAIGLVLWEAFLLILHSKTGMDSVNLRSMHGARAWLGIFPDLFTDAVRAGLAGFFILFGLRTVLRKDWVAAIVAALIFAATETSLATSDEWQFRYAMYVFTYFVLLSVVLRLGLVTTIAVIFTANLIGHSLLGTDWTTWYTPAGFATLAVVLAMAGLAFWKSLGNRDLFGGTASAVGE